jgi:hypothetical protein
MIKSFIAAGILTAGTVAPVVAAPLTDVAATNWAFAAIESLNAKYGCIAGYPNGTFKPENYATRSEMAALVNACVDRISEFQDAKDAQLAAALKAQAAQWAGTQAQVAKIQAGIDAKNNGVGNYLGAGVLLNKQGVNGNGYTENRTVSGGVIQGRYAVTNALGGELSVRPFVNFAGSPAGQIGAAGGALASYDYSLAKTAAGVSKANLYAGVGYQVPFVNNTLSNYQSAIGEKGQVVLALGVEGRLTNSLVGFADLKFPTTNAANSYGATGGTYSPVFSTGLGFKF